MRRNLHIDPTYGPMAMAEGIVYKQVESWYGGDNRALMLNVIRRYDGPHPLIVWLTGGGWSQVSKNVHVPELIYLVEAGFTVATVEYRTSEAGCFPAPLEDVKAAIRYLRAHAERWNIDPDHVGIMGESAGGHLASLAGTTGWTREFDTGDNLDKSSAVQAVCPWYGPSDFTVMFEDSYNPASPDSLMIGCTAYGHPDKAKYVSPVTYVREGVPPFLLIHGLEDTTVPFDQSVRLYDAIEKVGGKADLIAIEDAVHGDARFVSPEIRAEIVKFFKENLK